MFKMNWKKWLLIGVPVVLVVLIGVRIFAASKKAPTYETDTVKKQTLQEEVSVTGQAKSLDRVDLSFEKGGRIAFIGVGVGDSVVPQKILVSLANDDLAAQVRQAGASVASAHALRDQYVAALAAANAKLDALRQGTRPEEIAIAKTAVENAKQSVDNAKQSKQDVENKAANDLQHAYDGAKDVLSDAYNKVDDAVNKQIDDLFVNASTDPKLSFSVADSGLQYRAEAGRQAAQGAVSQVRSFSQATNVSGDDRVTQLHTAKLGLDTVRTFLSDLSAVVDSAVNISATTAAAYKTSINTARTNVTTAISAMTAQEQLISSQKVTNQSTLSAASSAVDSAEQALASAESQLALKQASATVQDIEAAQAAVKQAEANVASQSAQISFAEANRDSAVAQYEKTILRSPITGIVTKQDAKLGEIIAPNASLVSLMTTSSISVETFVPEADIVKVKVGNTAQVTLDAYGSGVVFVAHVTAIDPAETVIDGVSTYKVTLQFDSRDERIKSGMTANIDIVTKIRENALTVPARAVAIKNGASTVRVLAADGTFTEKQVQVGVRGVSGDVEIISGLAENDKVIVSDTAL